MDRRLPKPAFLCVLLGALAAAHAAPGDQRFARPGQFEFAGLTELNLYCMGSGSPTVVFDAGWEDWSPSWVMIQPTISRHTRTCSFDRAGNGFSLPGPVPRTTAEIAGELHAALHDAHIPPPYLLVGHSFGGYDIRAFADQYMSEVFGAVFVDIQSGDIESARDRATDNREMGATVREPPALHQKHVEYEQEWARTRRRLLSLSRDSRQSLVPKSDHYIQFDQPQVVIDAILGEMPDRPAGAE